MRRNGNVTLSLSVPPELVERLSRAADERVVGRNLLATRAIEQYLGRLIPVEELTRDEWQPPPAEPLELHEACIACGRWEMDHGRDHAFQPGVEVCAWSSGHATSDGYIPPACLGCPHG